MAGPRRSRCRYATRVTRWIGLVLLVASAPARGASGCLECDRETRKTFESLQAWRRQHNGAYPGWLADLKAAGLLPLNGGICPSQLGEFIAAGGSPGFASSAGEKGDPAGTYEYELSHFDKAKQDRASLPEGYQRYTRQDLKVELLRRPFFEQVPILRCNRHREEAPEAYRERQKVHRNTPVTGVPYWDGGLWEQNWLADVPYCAREVNVLFGLQGPPFAAAQSPTLPSALDLRKWNCAFGDHPWWWTFPMFGLGNSRQAAASLAPFFQGQHGRVLHLHDRSWWLNGLVQLQGKILKDDAVFLGPTIEAFVWESTNLTVGRKFREATWLQGTVWTASEGEIAGWLVWHYADDATEHVPLVYGRTTARFWGDAKQIETEKAFPGPAWEHHETAEAVGKERTVRLYQQTWTNPRPEVAVTTLDFVSNRECPAAPFLVAVNLAP